MRWRWCACHERRGTKASDPPAAGTIGQNAQALGGPGPQSPGQSWDGTGKKLVEAAHLCPAPGAGVDERITLQHATHPPCLAEKNPRFDRATTSGRYAQATARTRA